MNNSLSYKFLVFNLSGKRYALFVKYFVEVLEAVSITKISNVSEGVEGLINVRTVYPCFKFTSFRRF